MFGKVFSIIAGIGLINSFYLPWYKFTGVEDVNLLDVLNTAWTQPMDGGNLFHIATIIGIPILGVLMIITAIFPKLYLSIIKLVGAIVLAAIHVGYFYNNVLKLQLPFDWIKIIDTSPGFLLFCGALILYFLTVIFALVLSPVKGVTKLVGL